MSQNGHGGVVVVTRVEHVRLCRRTRRYAPDSARVPVDTGHGKF